MNKKGFAISVILYVIVFLIITIFYILLSIVKARYNTSNEFKETVMNDLNNGAHIYNKLDNDEVVNILVLKPNGGDMLSNSGPINHEARVVNYANSSIALPTVTRNDTVTSTEFVLSYDANGGNSVPASQTVTASEAIEYTFERWEPSGDCGTIDDGMYTFPNTLGTTCELTAIWTSVPRVGSEPIILANEITKDGYYFTKWKSSIDNEEYDAGSSYVVRGDTVMTAQWSDTPLGNN